MSLVRQICQRVFRRELHVLKLGKVGDVEVADATVQPYLRLLLPDFLVDAMVPEGLAII